MLPSLLSVALLFLTAMMICSGDASAGTLTVTMMDDAGKPLSGAVVFLDAEGASTPVPPGQARAVMDQIDKTFVPQVLVVPVGADVSFPNSDNIRHHVYSFSDARNFELPLYAGTPSEPVRFPVPGVVVLGCNIHDWMRGYIVVVPRPFFAVTGADGIAAITGLPAGTWQVRGWHPDLVEQRPVAGGDVDGDAVASSTTMRLTLKRKLQLRRSPAGRSGDRY